MAIGQDGITARGLLAAAMARARSLDLAFRQVVVGHGVVAQTR